MKLEIGFDRLTACNTEDIETSRNWHKNLKFLDTQNFFHYRPKIQSKKSFHRDICPKGADGKANSADTGQTAPKGAV